MSQAKIATPAPRGPSPATLRDPESMILDSSGTNLLLWCPQNRCGAIYHLEIGVWSMESPISFQEFLIGLRTRDLVASDSDDLIRWIDHCSAAEPLSPRAPGRTC